MEKSSIPASELIGQQFQPGLVRFLKSAFPIAAKAYESAPSQKGARAGLDRDADMFIVLLGGACDASIRGVQIASSTDPITFVGASILYNLFVESGLNVLEFGRYAAQATLSRMKAERAGKKNNK